MNELDVQPMMEIEIKFGKGKTDFIMVNYGDNPESLAEAFVKKHKLKANSIPMISQYIEATIEDFIKSQEAERPDEISPSPQSQENSNEIQNEVKLENPSESTVTQLPQSNFPELNSSNAILPPFSDKFDPKMTLTSSSKNQTFPQQTLEDIAKSDPYKSPRKSGLSPQVSSNILNQDSNESIYRHADDHIVEEYQDNYTYPTSAIKRYVDTEEDKEILQEVENMLTTNIDMGDYQSPYLPREDEEEDEETRYNRLKYMTMQSKANNPISNTLKPSSKTLTMGKQKQLESKFPGNRLLNGSNFSINTSENRKSIIGKTVNERLYKSASLIKEKRELIESKKVREEIETLHKDQYKVNDNSRRILKNVHHHRSDQDLAIGDRLYNQGLKDFRQKICQEEKQLIRNQNKFSDWSCAKCGTFHNIPNDTIIDLSESGYQKRKMLTCSKCGWHQDQIMSDRPVNIGLSLNQDANEILEKRNTERGGQNIHESLFQESKDRTRILQLNRALWEELNSEMTFKPSIPDSSQQIINKYLKDKSNDTDENSLDDNSDQQSVLTWQTKKSSASNANKLSGHAIKDYFQKSTVDRLVSTKTRSAVQDTIAKSQLEMANKTILKNNESFVSNAEDFIDRLVYEYKVRDQVLSEKQTLYHKYDPKTGQLLFKPKVEPIPEGIFICGQNLSSRPKNIWNDILLRDARLLEHKLALQKQAIEITLADIQKNQIKALPTSNDILEHSTQENLEELYKLLLLNIQSSEKLQMNQKKVNELTTIPELPSEEDFEAEEERMIQEEKELNKVTNEDNKFVSKITKELSSKDSWSQQTIDVMLINPYLMVNEISTLLVDLKQLCFQEWKDKNFQKTKPEMNKTKKKAAPSNDNHIKNPNELIINFSDFQRLIKKCIKNRFGPGKSYICAPKKQPTVALELKKKEEQEQTFKPSIDKQSELLSKSRKDHLQILPIESILKADGERVKEKIEKARKEKILEESKELTFKPNLFKPPPYVIPKYRGMDFDIDSERDSTIGDSRAISPTEKAPLIPPPPPSNSAIHRSDSTNNLKGNSLTSANWLSPPHPTSQSPKDENHEAVLSSELSTTSPRVDLHEVLETPTHPETNLSLLNQSKYLTLSSSSLSLFEEMQESLGLPKSNSQTSKDSQPLNNLTRNAIQPPEKPTKASVNLSSKSTPVLNSARRPPSPDNSVNSFNTISTKFTIELPQEEDIKDDIISVESYSQKRGNSGIRNLPKSNKSISSLSIKSTTSKSLVSNNSSKMKPTNPLPLLPYEVDSMRRAVVHPNGRYSLESQESAATMSTRSDTIVKPR